MTGSRLHPLPAFGALAVALFATACSTIPSATRSPSPLSHGTTARSPAATVAPIGPADTGALTGRIVFSSEDDVYSVRPDGTGLRRLTARPGAEFDPAWSPDGTRIVYRDSRRGINNDDEIYVMNADGSGRKDQTRNPANDWGPAWSPNGKTIAFNSDRGGGVPQIYVMDPGGGHVRRLTEREGEYPCWSPDGKRLAFMSAEPWAHGNDPDYNIYVMNADGTGQRRLTTWKGDDGWPAWSPDGRTIAFSSSMADHGQSGDIGPFLAIFTMRADGSGLRQVSDRFGQFVVWSPDGRRLLVSPGLTVMNPDGSDPRAIGAGVDGLLPDWVS